MPQEYGFGEYETHESSGMAELDRFLENLPAVLHEGAGPGPVVFPPIVIFPLNTGRVVLRQFSRNSAKLTLDHQQTIAGLAQNVVQRFGTSTQVNRIQLVGHADSSGSQEFNLIIGHRRARAVRLRLQSLIEIGGRFTTNFRMPAFVECSAGASQPDSTTAAGNRRVEILLFT
jgi:outer membrane protein OmpA-like peptidoglycan-associated protein